MTAPFRPAPTHVAAQAFWAGAAPERPALRWKEGGGWSEITRAQFVASAARVSVSLAEAGIRPGDRVGIVGPSNRAWLVAALGAHARRAVTVGAYPTSSAVQLEYLFGHSRCRAVVVSDPVAAERVLSARRSLKDLELVVVAGGDPDEMEPDTGVISLEQLTSDRFVGDDAAAIEEFGALAAAVEPDDLCTIVYTSGTTGPPKGAVHSFRSIGQVTSAVAVPLGYRPDDEYIVHLPLNHLAEQTYSVVLGGQVGWTLNLCESHQTLARDLIEIRPTIMFGVPRLFEKVREQITASDQTESNPLERFGMDRLRLAVCGGAPLSPLLVEFFAGHGLTMLNTYGMSEAGAISAAWRGSPRPDTCGQPFPGVEVEFADDGECLVRSSGVMLRYFNDEEATREAFDDRGFFRTGDIGRWSDGDVELVDRKKDIIITSGGKNVAPSPIEHALAAHELVSNAVVVGNNRRYLVALLTLDVEAIRKRALDPGAIDFDDPVLHASLDEHVQQVNSGLSNPEQIKRWSILMDPPQPGDPELTPTMKVKRSLFETRYEDIIDSLYE